MKKLFAFADEYIRQSDWKVLAALKLCLFSMGMMLGIHVAPKHKKPVFFACLGIFVATYIPLMAKCLPACRECCKK